MTRISAAFAATAACATAACAAALLAGTPAAAQQVSPVEIVSTIQAGANRPRDGMRVNHPKGVCASGEWVSTGAGARLSIAPDLAAGFRAPVVARFSIGGPNPRAHDGAPGVRGLAFAIPLPHGGEHHFALISTPVFAVATPADFVENIRVRMPDPATGQPNAERIAAFVAAHPEMRAIGAWLGDNPPSTSYATAPYFGIHTFFAVDAAGVRRPVRWTFEPVAGRQGLTPEQRQQAGADFLLPELRERVARAPAEWRVLMVLGKEGDSLADPTRAWPAGREEVEVARLRITAVAPAGESGACDPLMFSPLALPAGLLPSEDPVLLARTPAYAVSFAQRRQPQ